jgi:O-antigen ligase
MYGLMGLFQPESYYSAIMLQGLTIAQMLVLMLISFNLMKNKRVLNIALISLLVSCGFVAIMQLLGITATESLSDRISVLGEDPNIAASVLAIGAVVLIGFIMKESLSTKIKLLLFGLLLPTVLAIIHTGSRGALIALAVGLLVFTLSKGNMKIKLRNTIVVILCFAALVLFSIQNPSNIQRWESTLSEGSLARREFIYPAALNMFAEKPLLGWGPFTNVIELGRIFGENVIDTHNLYLWILTEVGLIGSIPFFWGLWLSVTGAWTAWRRDNFILPLALLATVFTINMTLTWHFRKLFWIVLALALSAASMNASSIDRKNGCGKKRTKVLNLIKIFNLTMGV